MSDESADVTRDGVSGPEPDRRWTGMLQAVCDLLGQPADHRAEAISVTLRLGDAPGQAAAAARLGSQMAAERGLRATAVISDHTVTFRFTRSEVSPAEAAHRRAA